MKAITVLLTVVACASAGLVGPPALYHGHHHHPAFYGPVPFPVVKHAVYAVPPPPIYAKPIVYAPQPVVKVLHHAPVVKTLAFGPLGYGAYDHHHHHHHPHHHHGPIFF